MAKLLVRCIEKSKARPGPNPDEHGLLLGYYGDGASTTYALLLDVEKPEDCHAPGKSFPVELGKPYEETKPKPAPSAGATAATPTIPTVG